MSGDLTEATVVVRAAHAASRELEGKMFIVMAGCPDLVTLNETGTAVWRHLQAPLSIGELADRLAAEFEIQREAALADCVSFVEHLARQQLVQLAGAAPRIACDSR